MPTKQDSSPKSSSPVFKLNPLLSGFVMNPYYSTKREVLLPNAEWNKAPTPGPAKLMEHVVLDQFFANFTIDRYINEDSTERESKELAELSTDDVHLALESMKWTVALMCEMMDIATHWEQLMLVPVVDDYDEDDELS